MLDGNGEYLDDIHSEALKDASTVGMTILPSGDILTLNWRTKEITKCTHNGETLQVMSFSEFMEPIDITVDSRSRILIADTGCAKVGTKINLTINYKAGKPLFSFDVGAHCDSAPVTCVCIGLNDEILVGTCSSLLLFDPGGRFLRDISVSASSSTLHPASFPPSHRSRFRVTACAVCQSTGDIISAVIDAKTNRAHLAVSQYKVGVLLPGAIRCCASLK
ncbi:unnamed protein product [Anisakis simplex]|uniref:WD_REPEATS_REGION domain-containing protein n=1 Tax=Anisakis simplex TaxID=6269 RepID=A0A0M3KEV5_ANISI|nr:unnamed protein product [Anisakis simplex]